MKWFIIVLTAAAVLIGIGVVATGSRDQSEVSRNPEAAKLCDEGTADLHALRPRAAVEKLERCLQLDPSLAEASISRTLAYAQLRERKNMMRELARADSLTAALKDDRRRLVAQLRLSDVPSSRFAAMRDSVYDRLTTLAPDDIYVLVAGAERTARLRDDEQTARAWRRILDKNPNYANSYNMLGYLELNRRNYDLAIENMQKYAFLAPNLANPHDSLGDVYMVLGRYEEAQGEYQTAIRMQSDFYPSLIKLGTVHLARGQLKRGVEILEALRSQVSGSELEQEVDREIIRTYLRTDLKRELDVATSRFVVRYPDTEDAPLYRAVRLAYLGQPAAARAVMDSSLATWREEPGYTSNQKKREGAEFAEQQFEGIAADLAGDAVRAAEAWARAIQIMEPNLPYYRLFNLRYRLAASLRAGGRAREALAEVDPVLAVNSRIPEALLVKVRCHLDLQETEPAQRTLQQLEWALATADPDLPILVEAAELRRQLGGGSAVP